MAIILPELSNFLKYGLIGFGAIVAVLSYFLLKGEQDKSQPRSSIIQGIYAFMAFGVVLMLIGLIAKDQGSTDQSSEINAKDSNNNRGILEQTDGGSGSQNSKLNLTNSDSNNFHIIQRGKNDTSKVK